MKTRSFSLTVFCTILAVVTYAQGKRITFEAPKVYPEGIAINPTTNKTYVSSVKTGTIGAVDENGKYTVVYQDDGLKSSFGMKVDEKKNMLWVCVGDPNYSKFKSPETFKKMARVITIDLATNKKTGDIDLASLHPGNHFPNDLTFDDKGNVYITDSFSPVIYKVDASGKPSVWSIDVGLNGIAYHPSGFILVAHNTNGAILKIDLKDPTKVERVKIPVFFPGADGMAIDTEKNLILVQNKGVNTVFKITSSDDWKTAKVAGKTSPEERLQNPTTLAMNKSNLFVLNAKLNELSDSTLRLSNDFSFQEVKFQEK